jgi:hypothetical protein
LASTGSTSAARIDRSSGQAASVAARQPGQDLVVTARRGVAEQHAVELHGQRELAERARPLLADLGGGDQRRASSQAAGAARAKLKVLAAQVGGATEGLVKRTAFPAQMFGD